MSQSRYQPASNEVTKQAKYEVTLPRFASIVGLLLHNDDEKGETHKTVDIQIALSDIYGLFYDTLLYLEYPDLEKRQRCMLIHHNEVLR